MHDLLPGLHQTLLLRLRLSLVTCVLSLSVASQSILVKPYLQLSNPTSIHILWETDTDNESTVQYGTTEALGTSVTGIAFNSLGGTVHHNVGITGLAPGTRYHYQASTGDWKSAVYNFVTPHERHEEEHFKIALMSDMQRDGGNPNIFHDIVNNSLIPHIHDHYGDTLNDHLQMVIIPGDLVDNGNVFSQWKNHFFNPAEELWHAVPVYPSPGNHENNSQNYFNYFHLPDNGTPGYEEHWYVHDYSNVRVLGMDSNTPYRIAAQLSWLDSVLIASCADTLVDFVFAQMHHPHKSELWTPGEISYTGDIIERLESFTDSCGKPTVHFFGHTHAYSRGHSQDHQHVWMNVATAGGNIDYWGEFSNADYEEFVVSEDEYGFVIAEVTAGEDPQFTLRRLSFGDEFNQGGSTETDLITIRINNNPPQAPLALFPLLTDTVSPVCFTLKADDFTDVDGDQHGASQWQISTDSADFSAPVADSWKQYANWYNEVDLQAGDDLTDEEIRNLDPAQGYFWRVRFRDKGLVWSEWTTPVRFRTGSSNVLTSNLVANGNAESGIGSWTVEEGAIESLTAGECNGISPYAGLRYFAVGALCEEHAFASVYQDIDVSAFAAQIDADEILVNHGAYMANWQNTDIPSFALLFLDATDAVISGTDTTSHFLATWTRREQTVEVPVNTRKIRYILMGTRTAGSDNDSYFDEIFLQLVEGDFECSVYTPPGPAHGRLYVDKDAGGVPNGESWTKAYRTLGDALLHSTSDTAVQEIWIAEGIYPVTTETDRDTALFIEHSVKIYGGFTGIEASVSERDPELYPVILSGETGDTNLVNDNVYHVVVIRNTADTTVLDGLTITKGYADGMGHTSGGGVLVDSTNTGIITIDNCVINHNYALGGSCLANAAQVIVRNSALHNTVIEGVTGGAILNSGALADLTLEASLIEQGCTVCPEVLLNLNGAVSRIIQTVNIEHE